MLVLCGGVIIATAGTACRGEEKAIATPTVDVGASTLFQQLIDGIDTGDAAAAIAVFADDAVSEGGPACATSPCVGKPAIQGDIAVYVHESVSFSACSTESSANTATARCEVRTNGTRRAGIDRFIASLIVEMRDGKLSAFRWGALDIADQQTATYWATHGTALYQQFLDGINRGDVAAVMALFAADAVVEGNLDCAAVPCSGREAIRRVIERLVADKIMLASTRPELFDPFGTFSLVTDVVETSEGSDGKAPTTASIELRLKGGNIASMRFGVN
jgi:hypothetical protein